MPYNDNTEQVSIPQMKLQLNFEFEWNTFVYCHYLSFLLIFSLTFVDFLNISTITT